MYINQKRTAERSQFEEGSWFGYELLNILINTRTILNQS